MNKQDLIAKIAKDVDLSKTAAGAAVDSFIDGVTKALKKGDSITFVGFWHVQDLAAEGAHRAQPADRRRDQDPEAPRGAFTPGKALKTAVKIDRRLQIADCRLQSGNARDRAERLRPASSSKGLAWCGHRLPGRAFFRTFGLPGRTCNRQSAIVSPN